MGVPVRNIVVAAMILAAAEARAADSAVGFSGAVPGAPLWPARATITSFTERAAIDITLTNPHRDAATVRLRASKGTSVPDAALRLPPNGLIKVRAFIDFGDDVARTATVCAIVTGPDATPTTTQACGNFVARRYNLD